MATEAQIAALAKARAAKQAKAGTTEASLPKVSRFRQQFEQSRPARGSRPVYVHGRVVWVPRDKEGVPQ